MKKRIAIVNQRYGLEVNGGSEYYTRLIAEKLNDVYEIEVLTTTAIDYVTWENHYLAGTEVINDIKVRRFFVDTVRDMDAFQEVNQKALCCAGKNELIESKWIEEQGPVSKGLIDYIRNNKHKYNIFIFVTYLYYHTVKGLPEVNDKAILIPTAHDEPYIYFSIFKNIFHLPKAFIFLTEEEQSFVHCLFNNKEIPYDIMGVGIDVPLNVDPLDFRNKYSIIEDYIIYVGRIDYGKNCDWLFTYFEEYKKRHENSSLKLVLMGKAAMSVPHHKDVINLGFVSEEVKFNGIAGAKALILPSQYESLSISVLEAMALSVPIITNGLCEVLRAHCIKSNGGFYYNGYFEFEGVLDYMLINKNVYDIMKTNARKYIEDNYKWDTIIKKFVTIIDDVCNGN